MSNTDMPGGTPPYATAQPWALATDAAATVGPVDAATPIYTYMFKTKAGRVKGGISEYQNGTITLAGDAFHIQGKAQLPARQQVLFGFGGGIGRAIAASIRIDRADKLTWDCIHQIVLEPEKKRICVVYTMPGKPKPFYSLAFLVGEHYDNFAQAARYFVRDKVTEGKIGPATPLWAWIVIIVFIALGIWLGIMGDGSHR